MALMLASQPVGYKSEIDIEPGASLEGLYIQRATPLPITRKDGSLYECGINEIEWDYQDIVWGFGPQNLVPNSTDLSQGFTTYGGISINGNDISFDTAGATTYGTLSPSQSVIKEGKTYIVEWGLEPNLSCYEFYNFSHQGVASGVVKGKSVRLSGTTTFAALHTAVSNDLLRLNVSGPDNVDGVILSVNSLTVNELVIGGLVVVGDSISYAPMDTVGEQYWGGDFGQSFASFAKAFYVNLSTPASNLDEINTTLQGVSLAGTVILAGGTSDVLQGRTLAEMKESKILSLNYAKTLTERVASCNIPNALWTNVQEELRLQYNDWHSWYCEGHDIMAVDISDILDSDRGKYFTGQNTYPNSFGHDAIFRGLKEGLAYLGDRRLDTVSTNGTPVSGLPLVLNSSGQPVLPLQTPTVGLSVEGCGIDKVKQAYKWEFNLDAIPADGSTILSLSGGVPYLYSYIATTTGGKLQALIDTDVSTHAETSETIGSLQLGYNEIIWGWKDGKTYLILNGESTTPANLTLSDVATILRLAREGEGFSSVPMDIISFEDIPTSFLRDFPQYDYEVEVPYSQSVNTDLEVYETVTIAVYVTQNQALIASISGSGLVNGGGDWQTPSIIVTYYNVAGVEVGRVVNRVHGAVTEDGATVAQYIDYDTYLPAYVVITLLNNCIDGVLRVDRVEGYNASSISELDYIEQV